MGVSLLRLLSVLVLLWWQSAHAISPSDLSAIKHRVSESLAYVLPANRTKFYKSCIGTMFTCNIMAFAKQPGFFQWRDGITPKEKERFWQTYHCIAKLNVKLCPVDGEWSLWTPWSTCSAPCEDIGNTTRERLCNNPLPAFHGIHCTGFSIDVETCMGPCDNSSLTSGYLEAEEHLASIHSVFPQLEAHCLRGHCDYDEVSRVLSPKRRDRYWSHLICYKYKRACPVDGDWTEWESWSDCSVPCGNGYQYRHRTCSSPTPLNGGRRCKGQATEQLPCVSKNCPHITGSERAVFTWWSDFSPCSVTCGGYGTEVTKRTCLLENDCVVNNNVALTLTMSRPCFLGACPVSGGWSKWSEWTECSAISGHGRTSRLRLCNNPYPSGGASCVGPQVDTSDCVENVTSFHLSLPEEGAETSSGSDIRDTGTRLRPSETPIGDPYAWPYDTAKESLYEEWTSWTACSQTCGGGYRVRTRDCVGTDHIDVIRTCKGEIQQVQFCNALICPENGGWGDWMAWSVCDVTCDSGFRHRYRRCDNPLPANGGACTGESEDVQGCSAGHCIYVYNHWSEWSAWSSCNRPCGEGVKERTREWTGRDGHDIQRIRGFCNTHACDEPGSWGMWGEWSACSSTCSFGHHYRDRTCTDPAPVNNGPSCPGPGTETAGCYKGPCEEDEPAIVLHGHSYLTYSAHVKHMRYLLLYLRFKPKSPGGTLFYRYRACKEGTWECTHVISLTIDDKWRPHLLVNVDGEELEVKSSDALAKSRWNDLLIGISRQSAYIRVNDGDHSTGELDPPLEENVDFDANMVIGAEKNGTRGIRGIISILRVNFKEQALMHSPYWLGPGAPDRQVLITRYNDSDSDMNYPDFWGDHYAQLGFQHNQILKVMLTVLLRDTDGLILYNEGAIRGAHVSLSVSEGALLLCFSCGETDAICEEASVLQLRRWYYLTLKIEATQASLRVNRGSAAQITCLGRRYLPEETVFLGGAPTWKWRDIKYVTGITQCYDGIVDVVVINGEKFNFRRGGLLSSSDVLNSMGYSLSAHVSEILEHATSKVTLRCDFTDFTTGHHHAKAAWLMEDQLLNITEGTELIPRLPGLRKESSLTLLPDEHKEGLYACLVNQDGRLLITHAFPLFRMQAALIIRVTTERSIIIGLIVFVFVIFAATVTMLVLKRDTIRHFHKTIGDIRDLEDSFGEPKVVDMDHLSLVQREEEEDIAMVSTEEELPTGGEEEEQTYQLAYIDEASEEEEKEEEREEDLEEDKKKGSKDKLDLSDVGSELAAKIIEDNKEKILELVASLGSLENFHDNTMTRRSSPSHTVRSSNLIHDVDSGSAHSAYSQGEVRRSIPRRSSGSLSPSRRMSLNLTGTSNPSSPPSPSRRGSALQPGSPRSLSMSISPPVGSNNQLPSLVKVSPNSSKPGQDQTGQAVCPIRAHGQVRSDYSGLALGLSGPPKQPFGPLLLSEFKAKTKKLSGESVVDTEQLDPPKISADPPGLALEPSRGPPPPRPAPVTPTGQSTPPGSEFELPSAPPPPPGVASPFPRGTPTPRSTPVTPTGQPTPPRSELELPRAPPPPEPQ